MPFPHLTFRQRLTYWAHLWKALTRQHHTALEPMFRDLIPADGVVIDAGAHAGQFTKLFAGLAREGRVIAFEPASYARRILTTAVTAKRLANVTVIAAGLSDEAGQAEIAMPLKESGSLGYGLSHFGAPDARPALRETVELMTLDGFVKDAGLQRVDLIKADIEGWEVHLIRGARATIAAHRPAIVLELVANHLARAGSEPAEVWAVLGEFGFAASRWEADNTLTPVDSFAGDGDYLFRVAR